MLFSNIFKFIESLIILASIPLLIWQIITKSKVTSKNILLISIIYMIYLFLSVVVLRGIFGLTVGLEFLYTIIFFFISEIIYIITIIISIVKLRKKENNSKNLPIKFLTSILIILPIIIITVSFYYEKDLIDKSDLILIYELHGNGFDNDIFGYAINDDYMKEISLGLGNNFEYLRPQNIKEDNLEDSQYQVFMDEYKYTITIYKDNKLWHQIKYKNYFNIDLEKSFVLEKN